MSKVTKSERITQLEQIAADQARAFKIMADRLKSIEVESKWIIHMTGIERPQLKQLDQSVFDELDEKWRFAAVDKCGEVWYSTHKTQPSVSGTHLSPEPNADSMQAKDYYDASNWQNSLIERDTAKELTGSDLSSELTGSDLTRKMLADGTDMVNCYVSDVSDDNALNDKYERTVMGFSAGWFHTNSVASWLYAVPAPKEKELAGSELCKAMLARGDKCVLIRMGVRDDKQAKEIGRFAIATSIDESGRFNVMSDQQPISKVDFAVPINNQGEPLTQAEAGL